MRFAVFHVKETLLSYLWMNEKTFDAVINTTRKTQKGTRFRSYKLLPSISISSRKWKYNSEILSAKTVLYFTQNVSKDLVSKNLAKKYSPCLSNNCGKTQDQTVKRKINPQGQESNSSCHLPTTSLQSQFRLQILRSGNQGLASGVEVAIRSH